MTERTEYVVCAVLTAKPGREGDVEEAMRALGPLSRAEPGCVAYHACRSVEDGRTFLFYERWADKDAFRAHTETEHFQRLVVGKVLPAVEARERRVFTEVQE